MNKETKQTNDVTPMTSSGPIIRAKEPSDYTPSTEEVRECWATQDDIGNPYEMDDDVDERHREKDGEFDRWLAEHDREIKAQAWEEGFRQEVASCASRTSMIDNAVTLKINPYESEES